MNAEKEYIRRWLPLVISGVAVLFLLVMVTGSTWAHFEAEISKAKTMQYVPVEDRIYILSAEKDAEGNYVVDENGYLNEPEGWVNVAEASSDTYALHFLLANGRRLGSAAEQTQTVALTVFATQGVADPSALTIALNDNGNTYVAKATEVKAGSAWHDTYGPGWTFRFYNGAGEELTWTLQGGVPTFREMTLTVSGAGKEDAMLTLLATIQPTAD